MLHVLSYNFRGQEGQVWIKSKGVKRKVEWEWRNPEHKGEDVWVSPRWSEKELVSIHSGPFPNPTLGKSLQFRRT